MKAQEEIGWSTALRRGLFELFVVLLGLVFVRKEVYLAGNLQAMILHWQEYALLGLMFIDGTMRGFGELHGQGNYMSPFRKKLLRYLFPFTLFLFVSCSSLCDKLNAACIHAEWWRDLGLVVLAAGVALCVWSQRTIPAELEAAIVPAVIDDGEAAVGESTTSDTTSATSTGSAGDSPAPKSEESDPASAAESAPNLVPEPPDTLEEASNTPEIKAGEPPVSSSGDPAEAEPPAGSGQNVLPVVHEVPIDEEKGAESESGEISTTGPWNYLRYPGRTSVLLELIGLSMTLSAWMPLLTLPGLFVLFKWELADLEAFRISQFGRKYLNYKQRSWQLIPYIY